jgi:predicted glycoside hydrolase/deacetylase ChbG (UPF0249 family)
LLRRKGRIELLHSEEMPGLIVNADDFGYTGGINRAVIELHAAGVLSSTTLMANGTALEDALAQSAQPSLSFGIGCHIVLVDGAPVSPRDEIRSLLDPSSTGAGAPASLRPALGGFVRDLLLGRLREDEIEHEAVAQIRLLQARGIALTHVDTHKHTHMFPQVLRPVLRAARACGLTCVRNPFEPAWSRAATPGAPLLRRAELRLLTPLRAAFASLVAEFGMRTTAGALGVLATGTLDAPTLHYLLRAAQRHATRDDAVWELVCHPGYHDAALDAQQTRLRAARDVERRALAELAPALREFTLVHFGTRW